MNALARLILLSILLPVVLPARVNAQDDPAGGGRRTGLVAHYYRDVAHWGGLWPDTLSVPPADPRNHTFTEYRYSRIEPLVNHLFIRRGFFTIQWSGLLRVEPGQQPDREGEEADFLFEVWADDGCRLILNGEVLIDSWVPMAETKPESRRRSAPVRLAPGYHEIVIHYFQGQSLEKDDRDPMRLSWSCPERSIPWQVIPASHFFHEARHLVRPR